MASRGCLKPAAPSLYHEVDRQNLLAEGGRKLSAAAESCPAPRRENFHGHQSLTESAQFTCLNSSHRSTSVKQGIY